MEALLGVLGHIADDRLRDILPLDAIQYVACCRCFIWATGQKHPRLWHGREPVLNSNVEDLQASNATDGQ